MKKIQPFIKKYYIKIISLINLFFSWFRNFIGKDLVKNFLILILLYRCVGILYTSFMGIGVYHFSHKQVEWQIKKDMGENKYKFFLEKKDLKGLGYESIIVFGYTHHEIGFSGQNGLRLIIYDQIQKSSIETLLFDGNLFEKTFDVELGYITNTLNNNGLNLISLTDIDTGLLFNIENPSEGYNYYGIIGYNRSNGDYEINSLINDEDQEVNLNQIVDCKKDYNVCKTSVINLFENKSLVKYWGKYVTDNFGIKHVVTEEEFDTGDYYILDDIEKSKKIYSLTKLDSQHDVKIHDSQNISIYYLVPNLLSGVDKSIYGKLFKEKIFNKEVLKVNYNKKKYENKGFSQNFLEDLDE